MRLENPQHSRFDAERIKRLSPKACCWSSPLDRNELWNRK